MSARALPAKAENLFRYLFEQASLGIAVEDLDGKILLANPVLCSMLGYNDDELVGLNCSQFANAEDSRDDCALFQQLRAGIIDHYTLEKRYVTKQGVPLWGNLNVSLLKTQDEESSLVFAFVEDITERKRTEETLRETVQRFRLAIQSGRMYAFDWNVVTDEIVRSKESVNILTWKDPEHDTGRDFHARVHPDDEALYTASETGLAPEDPAYQVSFRVLGSDGRIAWLEETGRAFFDIQGRLLRVMGMVADITERKQAEEALRQKEEQLTEAQRLAGVGNWQWDPQKDKVIWSKGLYHLFGRDPNLPAPSFKEHSGLYTAESWGRLQSAVRDALQSGTPYELDIEILTPGPHTQWVIARGEPLRDPGGQIVGLRGTVQDITERKRAEQALRKSEARERARVKELEAIWDAVPVPVLIAHDADCRYMTGNRAASKQFREPRDQNLSHSAPPGERPAFRHLKNGVEVPATLLPMQQAAATGKPIYGRELTLLYEDGTTREEIANALPLLDEGGKPRGAVGASIDVTELKRTERALRESEDKLRLLLDSTAEAIYGIDLEHRCTFCNPASLRTLGYEQVDEVLGKNMHKLIHHTRADGTPFPEEECRIHQVTQTGEGVHAEDELLWRADGTSFPAEYWSYPQRRGEEVVGAVVTFIDITERKLAEAAVTNVSRKLIEAQEQERTRIGRELHDDIGQRLALLAVELQRLQKDPLILPRHRNHLAGLHKRASEIAADTQSLSHELHSARLQYLGIAAAIRGFCREFGEQQKVKIDLQINDLPTPLSAEISLCLFRVLQEALHNSAKHSGGRRFEVRLWGTENDIHLTIKDSGKGFDREAAKTSQGIGLISMEERLKLVNGGLSIDSQPGRGTVIEARVPVISGIESMGAAS